MKFSGFSRTSLKASFVFDMTFPAVLGATKVATAKEKTENRPEKQQISVTVSKKDSTVHRIARKAGCNSLNFLLSFGLQRYMKISENSRLSY